MSRPLRIEMENGIYHVTSRGWERRVVVRDDRVTVRRGWRFFAWILMDNHFHLFFQTPEANLSAGIDDLNSGDATWFNRRYRRAETRCGEQSHWKQRLSRLEDSLRSRE